MVPVSIQGNLNRQDLKHLHAARGQTMLPNGQTMVQVTKFQRAAFAGVLKFFGGPKTAGAKRNRGPAARWARSDAVMQAKIELPSEKATAAGALPRRFWWPGRERTRSAVAAVILNRRIETEASHYWHGSIGADARHVR
jgi:hypothetical protein